MKKPLMDKLKEVRGHAKKLREEMGSTAGAMKKVMEEGLELSKDPIIKGLKMSAKGVKAVAQTAEKLSKTLDKASEKVNHLSEKTGKK